jgi:predicted DNA-binding transcriptional regulator AlpA
MTAAQVLRKNKLATVTGIDPKQASLENLAGIPGVTLCSDPADIPAMWEAIRAFRAEMEGRLAQLKRDPTICFPVKLLLLDELAQFMAMSRAIWRASKTAKDPGIPPVVQDIASVFWLGRAARCFGLVVAQKLDDRSLGNMGLRECLGAIALGGFRPNAYRMITGNYQAPKPQKGRGRWLWINDDQETWVQVAYGDPIKLRDYAMVNRLPMTQPVDRKTAA